MKIANVSQYKFQRGQLLVELLLAIALAAVILPGIITGIIATREGRAQQRQRFEATVVVKELHEAVRGVRERGWTTFATNGTYYPQVTGSGWGLATGSATINGFTRQIVISNVYRNTSGVIVASGSGATLDPSTKKVDFSVSWTQPYASAVSDSIYLTRHDSMPRTETTQAEFNQGTKTNTVTTLTGDGEVTLGAGGGGGDWCVPSFAITTVNLSRQGVPTAIAAFPGNIVTGTGGNASGPTFVKTTVSGNSPPVATIVGQFNNSKANAVFTETTHGYIATTSNSEEVQILNLTSFSDPPTNSIYTKSGSFNAPGNTQGNSVFAAGTVGYMTAADKFYTFDLTSISGSRAQLNPSAVTLAGTGNKVIVVGNYAFVAVNSTTTQLQIIDVTNPASPSIVASANLGNSQAGIDVAVNTTGTRAYIVTNHSATLPEFFIVNTSTKSGSLPVIGSGYNTSGMTPKGVAIGTGNRVIIVGTGGTNQYQVVNIANESSPVSCAGLPITNGAYAVATVLQPDGYAYSYVATGDSNAELKIILGGAGGQFVTNGTFESATFNPGYSTAFNRFEATVSQPSQTDIRMQVAVAALVSGSCTGVTYTYLGPNGDPGQYFTIGSDPTMISGVIPYQTNGTYVNPGQCFRYKVYFTTTDSTASPILYDMTVNYSP